MSGKGRNEKLEMERGMGKRNLRRKERKAEEERRGAS